jgi:hypothetical protein
MLGKKTDGLLENLRILKLIFVLHTILYKNEFQNPQVFQQIISFFPEEIAINNLDYTWIVNNKSGKFSWFCVWRWFWTLVMHCKVCKNGLNIPWFWQLSIDTQRIYKRAQNCQNGNLEHHHSATNELTKLKHHKCWRGARQTAYLRV